jgi:hypothetical protein
MKIVRKMMKWNAPHLVYRLAAINVRRSSRMPVPYVAAPGLCAVMSMFLSMLNGSDACLVTKT